MKHPTWILSLVAPSLGRRLLGQLEVRNGCRLAIFIPVANPFDSSSYFTPSASNSSSHASLWSRFNYSDSQLNLPDLELYWKWRFPIFHLDSTALFAACFHGPTLL